MATGYTNPFTGATISPTSVSYQSLTITATTALQWPVNGNTSTPTSNWIDVIAASVGLQLQLPTGLQVSPGQGMIIRNVGTNSFTTTDINGNTIVVSASGIANYVILTDNTTAQGVWSSVVFGASSSSANASSLAGAGMIPQNLTLSQAIPVVTVTAATTLVAGSRAQFTVWQGGVGAITLSSSGVLGNNWFAPIKNNGTGILTLTPSGSDTIDGALTQQLQIGESLVIVCNGTGFNTYGYGQAIQYGFTQLTKAITGGAVSLTSAEGANIIQTYIGALTANSVVTMPSTVQIYSLNNATSGAFTTTFKTASAGAQTVTIPQGQVGFVICDGTNIYSTTTASSNISNILTLITGTAGTPSINFFGSTGTGVYLPASNTLGLSVGGALSATLSAAGFNATVGITGGTF